MEFGYLCLEMSHLTLELGVVVLEAITLLFHGCYAKHALHTTKEKIQGTRVKVIAKPYGQMRIPKQLSKKRIPRKLDK